MNSPHLIIYILMIQLITALILPLLKKASFNYLKSITLLSISLSSFLTICQLNQTLPDKSYTYAFGSWNAKIGVEFLVNPLSVMMMTLIILLTFVILIYSFKVILHEIEPELVNYYYTLIFLMLFSMIGMILSNDFFNMYVFMEILSLTSCAIVSIKRTGKNLIASMKYLIQGTIGSVSILMGIAFLYMVTGSLNMSLNYALVQEAWLLYPKNIMLFLIFITIGLGIKAAVFPLHTWLPDAHSSAPTPSSALLSGLVIKIYIIVAIKVLYRIIGNDILIQLSAPLFLSYIAMAGMILGSLFAIGQKDLKKVLAYSSVSQVGYIILSLSFFTAKGLTVSLFHIVTHALLKSALFLSAGTIIYQTGKRKISELEGIGYQMPLTLSVFTVGALGMVGIPGSNGFISKWHLCLASLEAGKPLAVIIILISSFLNVFYYLPVIVNAFLHENKERKNIMIKDKVSPFLTLPMIVIALFCVLFGFYPQLILNIFSDISLNFIR